MKIEEEKTITLTMTENEFWSLLKSVSYALEAAMGTSQPGHTVSIQENVNLMTTLLHEMQEFDNDR